MSILTSKSENEQKYKWPIFILNVIIKKEIKKYTKPEQFQI